MNMVDHMKKYLLPLFLSLVGTVIAQNPGGVSNNLHLWLKADAGTSLSGSEVTSWEDQTPGGSFIANDDDGDRPSLISNGINFNPTLNFQRSANQDLAILGGITGGTTKNSYFLYIVSQRLSNGDMAIMRQNLNASRFLIFRHIGTGGRGAEFYYGNGTNNQGRFSATWANADKKMPTVWTVGIDRTSNATPNGTRRYISENNNIINSRDVTTGTGGSSSNNM